MLEILFTYYHRYMKGVFPVGPMTTLGLDLGTGKYVHSNSKQDYIVNLFDTSGQERF